MTDGIADAFLPYLLKGIENNTNRVYIPLVSFFADPAGFEKEKDNEEIIQHIKYFLSDDEKFDDSMFYSHIEKIYEKRVPENKDNIIKKLRKNNFPIKLIKNVEDDKTLVGLINTEIEVDNKEVIFYEEPDWKKLQEEWNRKAYPHLYNQESKKSESNEISFIPNNTNNEDKLNQKVENLESKSIKVEKVPNNKSDQDGENSKSKTSEDDINSKSEQEMENLKPETTKSYKFPLEETNKSNLKTNSKTKNSEITKKNDNHKEEETKTNVIKKKLKKFMSFFD